MDYCSFEDVTPLISRITLTSATPLTEATAGVLITQVSAEIDAHLRAAGYLVPASGGTALASLRAFAQSGVAARILRSLFPDTDGAAGERGSAAANERSYEAGLKLIDDGGLNADMVASIGSRVSHGFRDSAGVALSKSARVARTDLETTF